MTVSDPDFSSNVFATWPVVSTTTAPGRCRNSPSSLSPPRRFSRVSPNSTIVDMRLSTSWLKKPKRDEDREYQGVAR